MKGLLLDDSARMGLAAGGLAAIAAVLVSLPLRSPDDNLFNSATVAIGSLAAGTLAGVSWASARRSSRPYLRFAIYLAVLLGGSAVASLAIETQLDRVIPFMLPLAAIAILSAGFLTAFTSTLLPSPGWPIAGASALVALVVGVALAAQGDSESGRLMLPTPTPR